MHELHKKVSKLLIVKGNFFIQQWPYLLLKSVLYVMVQNNKDDGKFLYCHFLKVPSK